MSFTAKLGNQTSDCSAAVSVICEWRAVGTTSETDTCDTTQDKRGATVVCWLLFSLVCALWQTEQHYNYGLFFSLVCALWHSIDMLGLI